MLFCRNVRLSLAFFSLLGALPAFALAQDGGDQVHTTTGITIKGVLQGSTATELTLQTSQGNRPIAVNDIKDVQFADAPPQLKSAREEIAAGNFEGAADQLKRLAGKEIARPLVKQEIEYLQGLTAARAAFTDAEKLEAAKKLLAFVNNNKTSYNFYAANELLGDLLTSMGRSEQAAKYYDEVAGAPWPEFKMRATNAAGRALLSAGKPAEAIKKFDASLQVGGKGSEQQAMLASLGKAEALAASNNLEAGLKLAQQVLEKAPPDDDEVHARTYNTMGMCYLKANRKREALLAYLHTDLLFNKTPEAHAEALTQLAKLWPEFGHPERAAQAQQILQNRYGTAKKKN